MDDVIRFITVAAILAAAFWLLIAVSLRAIRWARKGSPGAGFIGWASLLLSAGMNPQPPPQEQVEEANRQKKIRKDAESGDPQA